MGLFLSKLASVWESFQDNPVRVCMLGLDAAGKTTVLYKVKLNETVTTIPTIGFNVETVSPCKGLTLTIWDVGGQTKIRQLWHHYYQNCNGLIYVIDSADGARFDEAREELFGILNDDQMCRVPILVMANKQDLPGAASVSKIAEVLMLNTLKNGNQWHVQPCCATTGEGIVEGFTAFSRILKEQRKEMF
ncbi:ADP-ribosylation factor 1-like [Clavelina lepadiformis]|uniref:ADP-ribosylation factor 1-like n=1 Tax=Clavelina lepadiformis TaxID=159417 RepID=UPI004042800C